VTLCAACSAESVAWLDTSPATLLPRLGIAYGSGAAYDNTLAGVVERRRMRHEEWAALVRRQRALIVAGCAAGHHSDRLDTSLSCL
jgi:hypothetical protein